MTTPTRPKTKTQALNSLRARQYRLDTQETKATEAAAERDLALYAAKRAGATRSDMEEATGLSATRVTQILRRIRTATA